jgi:bifunctional UDP-N-acetylglucosamine pyrophosphorylase/glucosamine-1-phosphate N-acetyltransferase
LTTWTQDPHGYGRILRDEDGNFLGIVEERDATDEQRSLGEINLGVYCFDGAGLLAALPRLEPNNAQGELYITDVAGMLVAEGRALATLELEDEEEGRGVNTLAQLSEVRWAVQMRILERHMRNGVLIEDPATTWIAHDVVIGKGTHVLPCVYIHSRVTIGSNCEVGPFTQLRPGTVLEDRAEVGNFTECKNSTLGRGSKAKHLSYLGDVEIGPGANIGAGTIFANYDGKKKWKTRVDEGAFIGSGTIIVAPGHLGARSITGAGAVVTREAPVGPDETWIGVPAKKLQKRTEPKDPEEAS